MSNEDKKDKKRMCIYCLEKFPKSEMCIEKGTYHCSKCYTKIQQSSKVITTTFVVAVTAMTLALIIWIAVLNAKIRANRKKYKRPWLEDDNE